MEKKFRSSCLFSVKIKFYIYIHLFCFLEMWNRITFSLMNKVRKNCMVFISALLVSEWKWVIWDFFCTLYHVHLFQYCNIRFQFLQQWQTHNLKGFEMSWLAHGFLSKPWGTAICDPWIYIRILFLSIYSVFFPDNSNIYYIFVLITVLCSCFIALITCI